MHHLWIAENEGATLRLSVMNALRNRGAHDMPVAVVDGLKGASPILASNRPLDDLPPSADRRELPEAINAAFPETTVQTCGRRRARTGGAFAGSLHLLCHSLNFCSWKDRKAVAAKLREVCGAETAEAAWDALEAFNAEWGRQYPSIAQAGRRAWEEVIPFFAFSLEIRKVIYTTNAVESLNRVVGKTVHRAVFCSSSLRKAFKARGSSPSEQAAGKLIDLAIRGHEKTARTGRGWLTAVNQFALMFKDRFSPMRG